MRGCVLLVLADDLTGALDTAVQFSVRGIPCALAGSVQEAGEQGEEVSVVDLATRHLPARQAAVKTREAAEEARGLGIAHLYLKVDSGLRGNIGATLEAASYAFHAPVFFAPAYPANGRTTVNGVQLVDGVPVSKSVYGKDLHEPVQRDRLDEIIRLQSDIPVTAETGQGACVMLRDAATGEALMRVAREARDLPFRSVLAGCAGLAAALADVLPFTRKAMPEARLRGPLLVVSASTSDVGLAQLDNGEQGGIPAVVFEDILADQPDMRHVCRQLRYGLREGAVILKPQKGRQDVAALTRRAQGMGLGHTGAGVRIARNMGAAAAEMMRSGDAGTVCVFGGDTLSRTLEALGKATVLPAGLLEEGVVLSRILYGGRCCALVTKSGSFGSPDLLPRLRELCKQWSDAL